MKTVIVYLGLAAAGYSVMSFLPYLFYPYLMAVCALVFILFVGDKKK